MSMLMHLFVQPTKYLANTYKEHAAHMHFICSQPTKLLGKHIHKCMILLMHLFVFNQLTTWQTYKCMSMLLMHYLFNQLNYLANI
jgi:hypothetical protein